MYTMIRLFKNKMCMSRYIHKGKPIIYRGMERCVIFLLYIAIVFLNFVFALLSSVTIIKKSTNKLVVA